MGKVPTSYKKGQSGNPNGRPKKGESLTETMRTFLDEAPPGQELTYKELFVKKSYQKAIEGDPAFARLVWNYIDGMPKQQVDVTSNGESIVPIFGGQAVIPKLSPDSKDK